MINMDDISSKTLFRLIPNAESNERICITVLLRLRYFLYRAQLYKFTTKVGVNAAQGSIELQLSSGSGSDTDTAMKRANNLTTFSQLYLKPYHSEMPSTKLEVKISVSSVEKYICAIHKDTYRANGS